MKAAKYHLQRAKIIILSPLAIGFIRTYGLLTALKAVEEVVFERFFFKFGNLMNRLMFVCYFQ